MNQPNETALTTLRNALATLFGYAPPVTTGVLSRRLEG
jgi:hypothetical protein